MKKLVTALMVAAFTLSVAGFAMAREVRCTVNSVSGHTVTMTCRKADRLKAGDKVKVKTVVKRALEGC
ncbi:hypothetical protein BMS3Bbin14_01252 [bacterium BMS3Bbin14]|uniref:Uncharacterized protein n=1 Tax=hydrothermal vent metagenome TaxID=652676 RepID=A0A3B0VPT8_9ZZZZ|nr:hypothetical protein BMS3Abin13_01112 [bacterium BMS3Abin13]GBE52777.1 hypothetical protein BMS3Bbin14_01252 [bacterium BMS3Bbin14]HDK43399.1 hypothetical protein [Desulfobacteraceae bacterium]HDL98765.1 hypothetical protein [Desulfobacteraceae bacterium]HDO30207.1 hypothetical protein [Desulfobacteraceae bacterium]